MSKEAFEKALAAIGAKASPPAILCRRCGRELTHPKSQQAGIGPECASKEGVELDIGDDNAEEQ